MHIFDGILFHRDDCDIFVAAFGFSFDAATPTPRLFISTNVLWPVSLRRAATHDMPAESELSLLFLLDMQWPEFRIISCVRRRAARRFSMIMRMSRWRFQAGLMIDGFALRIRAAAMPRPMMLLQCGHVATIPPRLPILLLARDAKVNIISASAYNIFFTHEVSRYCLPRPRMDADRRESSHF